MRRIKGGRTEGGTADKETHERKRARMTANKEVEVAEDEDRRRRGDRKWERTRERAGSLHFSSNIQQRFIQFILTRWRMKHRATYANGW